MLQPRGSDCLYNPTMRMRGAVLVWLLAVGAGTRAQDDPGARMAEIARRVEEIRGLTFRSEVPVAVVGRSSVGEYAAERLKRFTTPAVVEAEERAFRILGLLPPGVSVADEYARVVEESAAGYYDPEAKKFFLLDALPSGAGPIFAAHELTHALEDQYFDLDERIDRAADDGDRGFAVMAVHEGSASLVMAAYTARGLAEGWIRRADIAALASTEAVRGDTVAEVIPILRRPLLGAYVLGARFLARGRSEVLSGAGRYPVADSNRAYRDGPVSSEQILHPEKFWDAASRDDPTPVRLSHLESVLGEGWKREGTGSLGELLVGPLVGAPTPSTWSPSALRAEAWTNDAACGWDGDRWELWRREDASVVVLATVWDSVRDAKEFERALEGGDRLAARRSGNRVVVLAGDRVRVPQRALLRAAARP